MEPAAAEEAEREEATAAVVVVGVAAAEVEETGVEVGAAVEEAEVGVAPPITAVETLMPFVLLKAPILPPLEEMLSALPDVSP